MALHAYSDLPIRSLSFIPSASSFADLAPPASNLSGKAKSLTLHNWFAAPLGVSYRKWSVLIPVYVETQFAFFDVRIVDSI